MKEKKRNLIIYLILILITIIMCFPYLTEHYSSDDYTIIGYGYYKYGIEKFLNDGRVFSSVITLLAGYWNLPIKVFIQGLFYIGILISCLCVIKIKNIITKIKPEKNLKETVLVLGISYCIIFNFMYLENMYFAEIPIMALGILLFIKSSEKLVESKYLKSLAYLIIGELCYQGTINFFITFTFLLLIIKNKGINKEVIKKVIISGLFCLISVGINLIQIKLCGRIFGFEQSRLGGIQKIPRNITYIMLHIGDLLTNTCNFFPKYVFLIFLLILYITTFIYDLVKIKEYSNSFNLLLISIVAIFSSVAINIVSLSSFGLGRMVFSIGALIGLIFMYLYCSTNIFGESKIFKYFLLFVLSIYIVMNFLNYTLQMYCNKMANEMDKEEALQVNEYILEYEKNNNIEVKNIAFTYDKNITWNYNLFFDTSYTSRALMVWWCNIDALNYYTGRKLETVQMDENIYYAYFKGKDWDKLDKEQFVFKGDTVFYCVY
ncbi:MAG: glucosyltransferase domain-containing protein [Clostridia bacterium]|jgi:membrane protein